MTDFIFELMATIIEVTLREKDPISKPGVYEFLIDPGNYVVVATHDNYDEARQEFSASQGETNVKCLMNSNNKNPRQSQTLNANPESNRPTSVEKKEQPRSPPKQAEKRLERPGEKVSSAKRASSKDNLKETKSYNEPHSKKVPTSQQHSGPTYSGSNNQSKGEIPPMEHHGGVKERAQSGRN